MSAEKIITTMNHLEKLHTSLLQLARDKTKIITAGDMEALDQLLKDEQAHLAAIAQMNTVRLKNVTEFLQAENKQVIEAPTVSDVIEVAKEEERTGLEEARNRLLHVIHDLKWQNDLNQTLTYQSLQFVNLSLDMARPQTQQATYSKQEVTGNRVSKPPTSFDTNA